MTKKEAFDIQQTLRLALQRHREGRLQDAEKLYRSILQRQKKHPDANHNLGMIAVGVGQFRSALPYLKTALETRPDYPQFWISYIDVLTRAGEIVSAQKLLCQAQAHGIGKAAVNELKSLLKNKKESMAEKTDDRLLAKAIVLKETGQYKEAQKCFKQLLIDAPFHVSGLGHLAHIQILSKELEAAARTIEKAIKIAPSSPLILRNLARLCLQKKVYDQALVMAQKAYEKDTADPENQLVLAAAFGVNGQTEKERDLVEKILFANPDFAEAYAHRALTKYKQKDGAGALGDLNQAIKYKPHIPGIRVFLAKIQLDEGQLNEAIISLEQSLSYDSDDVDCRAMLGELYRQTDQIDNAVAMLRQAVLLDSNHAVAWGNLGAALQHRGNMTEAKECYRKALDIKPDMAEVANNWGCMYLDIQKCDGACYYFEKAVSLQPDRTTFLCNYAVSLSSVERTEEAQAIAEKAFAQDPGCLEAHLALATTLQRGGKRTEALAVFNGALLEFPEADQIYLSMANMFKEWGQLSQAESYARNVLKNDKLLGEACSLLATVCRFQKKEPEFGLLEKMVRNTTGPVRDRMNSHFALGKMYADIGDYDAAFSHYQNANDLRIDFFGEYYDRRDDDSKLTAARQIFHPQYFLTRKDWATECERPIFIVGMPRSGTTLLEQIIGSHKQVYAAGELPYLRTTLFNVKNSSDKQLLITLGETITQKETKKIASIYLENLTRIDASSFRITDKMPHNFELLWLIALAFPKAKVFHCVRDPLDTCLSCYFQNFSQPHPYKSDLRSLGFHYTYYQQLMSHWKKVLPITIHDIEYEQLVMSPDKQVPEIIKLCGLEFDPSCLRFYNSQNRVRTASAYQVRQKVYTSSVKKWERYQKYLEPLLEAMGGLQNSNYGSRVGPLDMPEDQGD